MATLSTLNAFEGMSRPTETVPYGEGTELSYFTVRVNSFYSELDADRIGFKVILHP